MATTLPWAVITTAISVDIVSYISVKHFISSPLADLVVPIPIDLLDIQPEADFVTCNKLASPNSRLVFPFACLPLLTHHALEAASIVVEHILFSDDLRLRTRALGNWEGLKTQGEGSTWFVLYWDIWGCWSRWDFSWPTHRVPVSHPSPRIPEFGC